MTLVEQFGMRGGLVDASVDLRDAPGHANVGLQGNHAIHMAAGTQIRFRHSDGRAHYDRKTAEGKTRKEALRSLKRRISDAVDARLCTDAQRTAGTGPGGQPGNDSEPSAAGSHPEHRLFGQATRRTRAHHTASARVTSRRRPRPRSGKTFAKPLDSKEASLWHRQCSQDEVTSVATQIERDLDRVLWI